MQWLTAAGQGLTATLPTRSPHQIALLTNTFDAVKNGAEVLLVADLPMV